MTTTLPVLSDHVRPDICGPCGGLCCKRVPGIAYPEDFGAPDHAAFAERIGEALASGRWTLDWWEGDPRPGMTSRWDDAAGELVPAPEGAVARGWYVRPAIRGHEGELMHPTWAGGACTFHSATGCTIFATRPRGCRDLVPHLGGKDVCNVDSLSGDPKRGAAIAWLPFVAVIESVLERVKGDD